MAPTSGVASLLRAAARQEGRIGGHAFTRTRGQLDPETETNRQAEVPRPLVDTGYSTGPAQSVKGVRLLTDEVMRSVRCNSPPGQLW